MSNGRELVSRRLTIDGNITLRCIREEDGYLRMESSTGFLWLPPEHVDALRDWLVSLHLEEEATTGGGR